MDNVLPKARARLTSWVKEQLSGGFLYSGQIYNAQVDNGVGYDPLERFVIGALFPIEQGQGIDPASFDDWDDSELADGVNGLDEAAEVATPVTTKRYTPPSSTGFSFYTEDSDWQLQLVAAAKTFQPTGELTKVGGEWRQGGQFVGSFMAAYTVEQLGGEDEAIVVNDAGEWPLWGGRACLEVRKMGYHKGLIITITLINKQVLDSSSKGQSYRLDKVMATLFDVSLCCYVHKGAVKNYPSVDFSLLSDEEQEIALQYKDKIVYAVGHGSAVDSYVDESGVFTIKSEFMPMVEVPQVTADVANSDKQNDVLSMTFLAGIATNKQVVCQALHGFLDDYALWINAQVAKTTALEAMYRAPAGRITQKMHSAYGRMKAAVALLEKDDKVACAFGLANQAMHEQMHQTNRLRGIQRPSAWRPFQLAFFLTTLVSAIDDKDEFRECVDLIWFATGGGKTEAYLALTAFVISYRRLVYPQTYHGLTAFMRYTLRLLTTQQFLRASRMICALELIRQRTKTAGNTLLLGDEPISIGLWVGSAASPNTLEQAKQSLDDGKLQHFVFTHCPWCDGEFTESNFKVSDTGFAIVCKNEACQFHDKPLPCQVVDEVLYQKPPTLLVATLDKFAQLTWQEKSNSFFAAARPPELIIQDELHLIAGSLGSVAGVYEAAIETVLKARGMTPKYIASTATIKEADEQVTALFGRSLAVFPPQGLNADDAYFAKTVPLSVRPGRLYVGYFSPSLKRQNNVIPLAATLFLAPFIIQDEFDGVALDAWWSKIFYHGSLKGVGNTHNALDIELGRFLRRLIKENKQLTGDEPSPLIQAESRVLSTKQLTSNANAQELLETFTSLLKRQDEAGCVDMVLATNMVAVGLDVARLALMVINGQPLTTAEYIQASSRVGRDQVPGIVYINYYRDQARSLSHYENFYPYHRSFYRYVEPTSVTPFAYQSRQRALHAGLVLAIRHSTEFLADDAACLCYKEDGTMDDTDIKRVIALYKQRCALADGGRAVQTAQHIDELYQKWQRYAKVNGTNRRAFRYKPKDDNAADYLLRHYGSHKGIWPTLGSMRNVEDTAVIEARLSTRNANE